VLSGIVVALEAQLYPSDKLVVDGVPKIPISLAHSLSGYQDAYAHSLLGWDPVKREIIAIRQHPQGWDVCRMLLGGQAQTLTYIPGHCYETLYQPQGTSLIFRIDNTSGSEATQLYHYNLRTASRTLLTDGGSRNLYPIWSNSGNWLMYSSNRRTGKDMDIYAVNPASANSTRLIAQLNGEDWAAFDWSSDDRKVILSDFRSTNESYLWILDVTTGEKTLLTPSKYGEKIFNGGYAKFSRDGKGVYHLTDRDAEFQRLAYVDIATGRYTYLSRDWWDVEEFALSPDRSILAFITNEEGISQVHLFDPALGKELLQPALPTGVISGLKWHNNSKDLAFVMSATNSPGGVFSIAAETGKVEQWSTGYAGGLKEVPLPAPEVVKWKSFDGRMISGFLYRPAAKFSGKRPY
jgi:Tol biopolymer transport system component